MMHKLSKIMWATVAALSLPAWAMAQAPQGQAQTLYMGGMLIYVLLFYALTMTSLALFLHRLVRPQSSTRWLYACTIGASVWAIVVTYQFKDVQDTQLTAQPTTTTEQPADLTPENEMLLRAKQQEQTSLWFGNYYIVAMPNFILLALGALLDYQRSRRQPADRS